MIEILSKSDIKKVDDVKVKNYLEYSFLRLPSDYVYPDYGYFVIIEKEEELKVELINLSTTSIKGIDNGLYDDINMVEVKDEIMEILVLVDNDINISLILQVEILENIHKERLLTYQI